MRRSAAPLLRRLWQQGTAAPCRMPAAAAACLAQQASPPCWSTTPASSAASSAGLRWLSASAESGSGGGSQAAWEDASKLAEQAAHLAASDPARAKQLLERELPELMRIHGSGEISLAVLHNQLALWHYYDGEYPQAASSAKEAYELMKRELGGDSSAAAFHGVRLGMALLANGDPKAAYPLLEEGAVAAAREYNERLEAVGALPSGAPAEVQAAAVAELQQVAQALLDARFYRALAMLAHSGPAMEGSWEESGKGAVLMLGQEMGEALKEMLRWVAAHDPGVKCALREHHRVVEQLQGKQLQHVGEEAAVQGKALHDMLLEAASAEEDA